jgi:hypothetical protein
MQIRSAYAGHLDLYEYRAVLYIGYGDVSDLKRFSVIGQLGCLACFGQ